jgi:hypothetical protein
MIYYTVSLINLAIIIIISYYVGRWHERAKKVDPKYSTPSKWNK